MHRLTNHPRLAFEVALELHETAPWVFKKTEVFVDGGIRYGSDVLKLLALRVRSFLVVVTRRNHLANEVRNSIHDCTDCQRHIPKDSSSHVLLLSKVTVSFKYSCRLDVLQTHTNAIRILFIDNNNQRRTSFFGTPPASACVGVETALEQNICRISAFACSS